MTNRNLFGLNILSEQMLLFGPEYLYIEQTTRMVGRHTVLMTNHQTKSLCKRAFIDGLITRRQLIHQKAGLGGSVGCAVRLETRRSWVQPRRDRQHSFVESDHEIFSTVIFILPLIQEGRLSVSGERMCTILVNRLEE